MVMEKGRGQLNWIFKEMTQYDAVDMYLVML